MRNIILGLIFLSYTLEITGAAIVPEDETYEVMQGDKNVPIDWVYDHEESILIVTWTFKNSTSPTATTVMTQLGQAQATPVAGYNISHVQNGKIQLQKITEEYIGIYYCRVSYTGVSGFSPVTGTATIKLMEASTEDKTSDTDAIVGGTVGGVLGLCCIAAAVVGIRHLYKKKKGRTITLSTVEGGKVTLSCPFPKSVTYPEWRGPPGLTTYTRMNDTSGDINPAAPAFGRLQYASNKRDLILSNAVISDSGDYTCSYTGQGNHTITLKVNRGKSDRASNVVYTGSHPEERQRLGRPQPPLPNSNHREGSGSVVSGRDVEMQETDTSLRRSHDRNVHHPANIVIPTRRAGALEPISAREEV